MVNNPMVTILCFTYNHEPYIADTLNGFMMQKVDFPVECLVVEDCSTDGTLKVIREYQEKYPGKIKVIMPPKNMKGELGMRMFSQVSGKYIALCEGDDYWLDEHKLQKQVNYMEEHPTCACCCCNSFFLDQTNIEESKKEKKMLGPAEDMNHMDVQHFFENEAYKGGTATMLYRNYHEERPAWTHRFDFADLTMLLQAFKHGYMHYSGEIGAVYRINVPGSYNGKLNSLAPVERATKWLHYWENVCEALQCFNADTEYCWDEAIQKAKRNIRDQYIAKQYRNIRIGKEAAEKSWQGVVPVIDKVLKSTLIDEGKRQIAIWGLGTVGRDLTRELSDCGMEPRMIDQKKDDAERPEDFFSSNEKCFVVVTMMRGYEEVEKQLWLQGYDEWRDYICLAKFTEIWLHYCS